MAKKRVSVAMATYNGERYIETQLKSILVNLDVNDEVIISDDGSHDDTINIIKSLNDDRVTVIAGPQKGIMKNFENAIRHTNGKYIFLSDQDDIWESDKVNKILPLFGHGNVKVIVHDAEIINEDGNLIYDSFFKYRKSKNGVIRNIIKNSFLGCTMSFTSDMKEKIVPIPTTRYIKDQWHDQWIGLICNHYGRAYFLKEKLSRYRRHGKNNSSFQRSPILIMIRNRILITLYFGKRVMKHRGTK